MIVEPVDCSNPRQVRAFLDLPFFLYRNVRQWVPPIRSDARLMLDPRRHPYYRHSQAAFFLVHPAGGQKPVGRLAVLYHQPFNHHNHQRTAFFYLFEATDQPAAARALFAAGEHWAARQGAQRILGPKGFSPFDAIGLLMRGFEYRPAFGIPYNPPYYPALLEACGFEPGEEILSGYLGSDADFPPAIHQIAARVIEKRGFRVASFRSRAELRRMIPRLSAMYNRAIVDTPGNAPVSDEEVQAILRQVLFFADLRLIKILLKDEQPVGFLLAYPDISAALQRTRGRLLPFGWLDWLVEMRRTPWLNINGAGIVEEHRGMGGTAILFSEMHKSIRSRDFEHIEVVQIGADNQRMLRELRSLGIDFYKSHCLYSKTIAA